MSSDSDRNIVDYATDSSQHEEGTLFLPAPEGRPDPWTFFFFGILIGTVGGALTALSPLLAGAMILAGYGVTAVTLKGSRKRFGRALRFGFAISALLGGALLAGAILAPDVALHPILVRERHLIFLGFALMPWVLGVLRYLVALVR